MAETLSHKFIAALYEARDQLYDFALISAGGPPRAEAALQQAARDLFIRFSKGSLVDTEVPAAMRRAIFPGAPATTPAANIQTALAEAPMPADVWARLTATIQFEAARSSDSAALHPDSNLLSPDPLLAPKKKAAGASEDVLPTFSATQILLFAAIAIVLGAAITVYLVTRPAAPRPATYASPTTTSSLQ